jgi:hypothetical protein
MEVGGPLMLSQHESPEHTGPSLLPIDWKEAYAILFAFAKKRCLSNSFLRLFAVTTQLMVSLFHFQLQKNK